MTLALIALAADAGALAAQGGGGPAPTIDRTIATYCGAWGEADRTARDRMLEQVWSPGGTYMDPSPARLAGREPLSAHIGKFLAENPGAHFRCGAAQTHHGWFRFAWTLHGADGAVRTRGMDVGELDPNGRILRIVGFFGAAPEVKP